MQISGDTPLRAKSKAFIVSIALLKTTESNFRVAAEEFLSLRTFSKMRKSEIFIYVISTLRLEVER